MHGKHIERWRRLGVATAIALASGAAHGRTAALQDQVNRLVDLAYEAPQQSLAQLNALKASQGTTLAARRIIEVGIGLAAADNSLEAEANAAIAELEAMAASAGPIAHADALLVRGDLELSDGQTVKSAHDVVAAVAAYAPYCDDGRDRDRDACSWFNWFWANMFAALTLDDKATRASSGIYLQAATGIAQRALRPDLSARATALSAQLAQEEGNTELSDRLIQRADALAVRSADDGTREFAKMFGARILEDRGDLAGSLAQLQDALQIAQRAGHARRVMNLADGLIQIDLMQGHPDRALQRVATALPQARARRDQSMLDQLHVGEIVALLRLGRIEESRQRLVPLVDSLDARLRPADRGAVIDMLGNALVAASAMDDAATLFQREQPSLLAAGDLPFERAMLARQAEAAKAQQLQRRAEVRRWTLLGGLVEAFDGTLLLLDVDHFKSINDTLGHAGGDAALREVAARLQSCLRDGDFVVRWGGEELVVAVLAKHFDADALVDRILQALASAPIAFQERAIAVSASIGYGSFPLAGDAKTMSFDEALAVVDAGMFYAKRNGRRAAVRIARLPRALLADLGGLPQAFEREVLTGAVELQVRRLAAADADAAAPRRPIDATAPLAS